MNTGLQRCARFGIQACESVTSTRVATCLPPEWTLGPWPQPGPARAPHVTLPSPRLRRPLRVPATSPLKCSRGQMLVILVNYVTFIRT